MHGLTVTSRRTGHGPTRIDVSDHITQYENNGQRHEHQMESKKILLFTNCRKDYILGIGYKLIFSYIKSFVKHRVIVCRFPILVLQSFFFTA